MRSRGGENAEVGECGSTEVEKWGSADVSKLGSEKVQMRECTDMKMY